MCVFYLKFVWLLIVDIYSLCSQKNVKAQVSKVMDSITIYEDDLI